MMELLKARFSEHKELHPDLEWSEVEHRLREFPAAIAVLQKMEESGGEPDTIGYDEQTGKLIFCDCAKESPSGRRSLCYDEKALQGRTKNPPSGSTERIAKEIGVSMMTEELYRRLQSLGYFDLKTSSWIATPDDIRSKGGALFCERRYDTVFTFHNSADSYYSVRGFRGYILFCARVQRVYSCLSTWLNDIIVAISWTVKSTNSDLSGRSFDVRRYNEHWILPHKIQETKQA